MTTGLSSLIAGPVRLLICPPNRGSTSSVGRGKPVLGHPRIGGVHRRSSHSPRWTPSPSRSCVVNTRVASRPSGPTRGSANCSRPRTPTRCRNSAWNLSELAGLSGNLSRILFSDYMFTTAPAPRATAPAPRGPRNSPVHKFIKDRSSIPAPRAARIRGNSHRGRNTISGAR
jgi:hypothetical protein